MNYLIRRSRRTKRVGISVHCDGRVTVALPWFVSSCVAEKFVQKKEKWILAKLEYYKQFENTSLAKLTRKDYLKHKESARELVRARVGYLANLHGFTYNRIAIRNQKSRWGSCSVKGNLNFNYKILLISPDLRDYIIVHELCHLQEMNHSAKFWALVAKIVPNHKKLRRELRGIL